MYRTSTQVPQYKHERELRHVESRGFSEESTSSSEEEEESSGKYTEGSGEDTTESHESHSFQKRSDWSTVSPTFEHQWRYNKVEKPEKYIANPYVCDTRILKQDKVTQKNLLSPFPSFLVPPIPRQVTGAPNYRLPNDRFLKEEQKDCQNETGHASKKNRNYRDEEENTTCVIHKNHSCKERKMRQKRDKILSDQLPERTLKPYRPERVLTCLHSEGAMKSSRDFSNCKGEGEGFSKRSTSTSKSKRRPKSSNRETSNIEQTVTKFADCNLEHRTRGRSKGKATIKVVPCEKDTKIREAFRARNAGDGKLEHKKGGEVKEKLVYVVEEEGKDVTKLETDLFTLNEILAIKRDLLELSEFAKKLKKLKEMKKESENAKNKGNSCPCKPAEELLKDVNRRIEILEARQEELERGSSKAGQKEDTETESKNMNDPKTSSGLLPKTPMMIQSSAMTTVPSFPKTEVCLTRPGLSNNSDIVNELMDIKTQLQKLEKRRMSKEVSSEAVPEGNTKSASNKNHAIAVFSSRTYILTSENFEKRKMGEKIKEEEKGKRYFSPAEENAKSEQRKANVANWLKNVTVEQTETDVSVFLTTQKLKREKSDPKEPKGNANVKYRNCTHALKVENFENQELQKKRKLEANERKGDISFANLLKNESSIREINRYVGYKKCIMTPSGRLFALMSESSEKILKIPSLSKVKPSPEINSQRLQSKAIHRSCSTDSVISAVVAKQRIRRLKAQTRKNKRLCEGSFLCSSQSKSMQELSVNSSVCKSEKTMWNINVKNFGKMEGPPLPKNKKHKENKNEFVKYLEAHLMALKKNCEKREPTTSSCTYSEFLASVNLDTEDTSAAVEPVAWPKKIISNEIYTYTASTRANANALDSQDQQEENCKEKKKEKKEQRKKEKKEKNKSVCKKKSKPIKEKKCKEPKKQKKCEEKKKKEKKEGKHQCKCKCRQHQDSLMSDLVPASSNSIENDHQPHSKSRRCPTNRGLGYDFNSKRNCSRDDHVQQCDEKASTSHHPKVIKEDSLEIYKRQQRERSKINLNCKKPAVDSFTIRNIFKNLGRYYPKISNFHLFPFGGEFYDKKPSVHTKSKHDTSRIIKEFEDEDDEEDEDDCDDVDDERDEDYDETHCGSYVCQSRHNNTHPDHKRHHYYHHATKQDDLKNCGCVRVYLQTQEQRGWSGLGPFRALSLESLTAGSASRTTGSRISNKKNPLLPKRKSQILYVGHSTQKCIKKKSKCSKKPECNAKPKRKCNKKPKCKCKCKCKKKPKKEKKHKEKHCNVCVCSRCGNVHKLKKKKKCECVEYKRSKRSRPETPPRDRHEFLDTTAPIHSSPEKHSSDAFPLLSFFTNFCKVKPRESKFSKSMLNKISEVRSLKTCPRVKPSFFSKLRNHLPLSNDRKSQTRHNSCHCTPRLQDIENRLEKLEEKESCDDQESDVGFKEKKEKKKEKEKKKCLKEQMTKCRCADSSESKHSCLSVEFICCRDEEKKKEKKPKKKKKKKHKKHKKKCCCSESNEAEKKKKEESDETAAYYYTIKCSVPETSTSKVATTKTTEEEEEEEEEEKFPRTTKSKELLEQKSRRLKGKLSSLTYFWKNLRKHKITKNQSGMRNSEKIKNKKSVNSLESEIAFFDDYSKNGSRARKRQVYEAKEKPMPFLKKLKKIKGRRKEKEKEKKEKKVLKSEAKKRSQK